jgi:hypothetical protein
MTWPVFAAELAAALDACGEAELREQVERLPIVEVCSCDDDFCQSFHTAPTRPGPYGDGHRNVCLDAPWPGYLILDVVHDNTAASGDVHRGRLCRGPGKYARVSRSAPQTASIGEGQQTEPDGRLLSKSVDAVPGMMVRVGHRVFCLLWRADVWRPPGEQRCQQCECAEQDECASGGDDRGEWCAGDG